MMMVMMRMHNSVAAPARNKPAVHRERRNPGDSQGKRRNRRAVRRERNAQRCSERHGSNDRSHRQGIAEEECEHDREGDCRRVTQPSVADHAVRSSDI